MNTKKRERTGGAVLGRARTGGWGRGWARTGGEVERTGTHG